MLEDSSGIPEQLLNEIEALQEELSEKKEIIQNLRSAKLVLGEGKREKEELTVGIFLSSEKPLIISGVALAEGIWKNVVYTAEEIEKAAKQLIGKPIHVEHGNNEIFQSRTVGKVITAKFDQDLQALKFRARINDKDARELVLNGTFKAVSLSTWMEKVPINEEGTKFGYAFQFAELSLVENPACEKCFIFHCEQLSKKEKTLKVNKKKIRVEGEIDMEDRELIETLEASEELDLEELSKLEELEKSPVILAWVLDEETNELEYMQLETEEELQDLKQKRKVVGYYYGYPYLYPYYSYYGKYYYPYKRKYGKNAYRYYPYKYKETKEEVKPKDEEYYKQYPEKDAKKDQYEPPYEEMEDKIKCKSCGKEFDNWKDFVDHWVKEHKEKYGPYKSKEEYPKYPEKKELSEDEVEILAKFEYKIVYNKRTKKYTVFKVPEKGLWKIIKGFDTEVEAKKYLEGLSSCKPGEEPYKEEKQKITCPVCGEEFGKKEDFLKHWVDSHKEKYGEYQKYKPEKEKEEDSEYTDFIGKCRKEGKSMKECAIEWTKMKEKMSKENLTSTIKCPVCGKRFKTGDELITHWDRDHKDVYGPYGKIKKLGDFEENETFQCPACEKKFKSKKAMIAHFNREHAEEYGKYGKKKGKEEMSMEEGEIVENPTPETKPEKVEAKPETPEVKPEVKPTEVPAKPEVTPETPEVPATASVPEKKPEIKPIEIPVKIVVQETEVKPPVVEEKPVAKPEVPEIKPEIPEPKPEKPHLTEDELVAKIKEKLPKGEKFLIDVLRDSFKKSEKK